MKPKPIVLDVYGLPISKYSYIGKGPIKMKPGPEMDALIAEKVMGWYKDRSDKGMWRTNKGSLIGYLNSFTPSTEIAPAWQVVEKMGMVTIEDGGKSVGQKEWSVGFVLQGSCGNWVHGSGDTAPHAICLAALKAKGINF